MTPVPDNRLELPVPLTVAVLCVAAFAFVLPMMIWGYAPTHDFTFHVGNWMEIARQWHQGIFLPRWASHANYGFGEPRFIFYPPLANMLGAVLSFALPWRTVPGAFAFVVLAVSGLSMFTCAREWLSDSYAILAAVVYVLNPYEVMLVYKRFAAAEMFAAAIFPLLLLLGIRVARGQRRAILPLAFTYAAIWLTNAPSAVMASYVIALLVAVGAARKREVHLLAYALAAMSLGVGLAAFYIVPAAWEQRWVNISLALTLPHNRPENNFIRLFPPRLPGGIGSIIGVGAANLVLAVALFWLAYARRRTIPASWWNWTLVASLAALFTLPISFPLWKILPKMIFVQLPWRWLFVLNAACALLLCAVLPTCARGTRIILAALPVLIFFVLIGAYATKGRSGGVGELRLRIEREGGVWPEAQYLPLGGVRGPGQSNGTLVSGGDSGPANVRFLERTAEHLAVETSRSTADTLVLNIAWYPSWSARINGASAFVQDHAGQVALEVPPGKNRVDVVFVRTPDRTLGGIVSALTVSGIALAWFIARRRMRATAAKRHGVQQRA